MSTQSLSRAPRPVARVPIARQGYLKVVPQRRPSAPRAPFVVVVVGALALGLLGLLALNTVLAQDAFRLHVLQRQSAVLADQELNLQRQVEARRAPADLAARAAALGLVQGGPPAFLRLSDGVILGQPNAAGPDGVLSPSGVLAPGGVAVPTVVPATVVPATVVPATVVPAGQPKPTVRPVAVAKVISPSKAASHSKPTSPSRSTSPSKASGSKRPAASSR